jgi:uncharacterized protein (TIGR03086 family)
VYHESRGGEVDSKDLFRLALSQATAVVQTSGPEFFDNDTPCTDWNCQALLNHMLYELSWVDDLLQGKTVAEVGGKYDGDLIKPDYHDSWHATAHKAMEATKKADPKMTVHLSYADVPVEYYINEIAIDMLIHGWDLAQSLQYSLIFEPQAAETLYKIIDSRKEHYSASGLFGEQFQVSPDSRLQTKLLALVGRHEPAI